MRRFVVLGLAAALLAVPAAAPASPELSTGDQLKTRRYVSAGDRAYVSGFQDGRFYAQGWHVTGEMGGVWSQPLKLVDGVWFGVGDDVAARRPRGSRAAGATRGWSSPTRRACRSAAPTSRPMACAPCSSGCGCATPARPPRPCPSRSTCAPRSCRTTHGRGRRPTPAPSTCTDTGAYADGALVFRDAGTPHPNAGPHDWAAAVGSTPRPVAGEAGAGHWGAQAAPVLCDDREPVLVRRGPVRQGHRRAAALPRSAVPAARRADAVGRRRGLRSGRRRRARRSCARRWRIPTRRCAAKQASRERLVALLEGHAARRRAPGARGSTGASRTSSTSPSAPTA